MDKEAHTVSFEVPAGTNLANAKVNIGLVSTRTTVFLDGEVVEANKIVDFSSQQRTFVLEAISGVSQEWVFEIVFE